MRQMPLFLAIAPIVILFGCDSASPSNSSTSPGTLAPSTQTLATCKQELSESTASNLVGFAVPDSTSGSIGSGTRQCEWSGSSTIAGRYTMGYISWVWRSSPTEYQQMLTGYNAAKVKTLADGRICTRVTSGSISAEYLYKTATMGGLQVMRLELSDATFTPCA